MIVGYGLDIGKKINPTCLCRARFDGARISVDMSKTWPLNTPYVSIAGDVAQTVSQGGRMRMIGEVGRPLAAVVLEPADILVVDTGGVGEAVFELLQQRLEGRDKPQLWGVNLVRGRGQRFGAHGSNRIVIGKQGLIGHLALLTEKAAYTLEGPDRDLIREEMRDFQRTYNDKGYEKMGGRYGKMDDRVLALALALIAKKLLEAARHVAS